MYLPAAFCENDEATLAALIKAHPLATLITHGPLGLMANLVPFVRESVGGRRVLRAHLARANPQLAEIESNPAVLIVFQGPEAYITPSWYATKSEHGKVVPTWNYIMVQAHGAARVVDEPEWLGAQLVQLTDQQECTRQTPWSVSDAPAEFIASQMRAIRGLEVQVDVLEGMEDQPEPASGQSSRSRCGSPG
jgi:transcriptional regulator